MDSVKINKDGAQVVVDGISYDVADIYNVSTPTEEQWTEKLKAEAEAKAAEEEAKKKSGTATNTSTADSDE